jgi:hypothetical protein
MERLLGGLRARRGHKLLVRKTHPTKNISGHTESCPSLMRCSPGQEGPKSEAPRAFKYFLWYYILFEKVAPEKRLVLKFDARSCNLCMKATIPWLPYHIS